MLHTVSQGYYEEPYYFRDVSDIKSEIESVRSSLKRANKKIEELEEAKENVKIAIEEGNGEERELLCELEDIAENAEMTYSECNRLVENLECLKDELDETLWWAKNR